MHVALLKPGASGLIMLARGRDAAVVLLSAGYNVGEKTTEARTPCIVYEKGPGGMYTVRGYRVDRVAI